MVMSGNEDEIIQMGNLAERLRQLGRYEDAARLFSKTMVLISEHGAAPHTEAAICSNFGQLLTLHCEHELAVNLQRRALELDKKKGSKEDLGFSHHNLGLALLAAKKKEEAIFHLQKALDYRRQIWDFSELAVTVAMLLEAFLDADRNADARSLVEEWRDLERLAGRVPALRTYKAAMAKLAMRDGCEDEACRLISDAIDILEEARREKEGIERLDLFDARYNKHYLEAIELFLACGRVEAALVLIDRTRFRSACDTFERCKEVCTPVDPGALELPPVGADELFLVEWVYPSHDWSFSLRNTEHSIGFRRIKTSNITGPPKELDLATQWREHFWGRIRQTQAVIDCYQAELKEISRLRLIPHGAQWQTPFAALMHPVSRKPLLATHEVLVVPSLRYCELADAMPRSHERRHLVVGDPNNNLTGAREEALSVARILDCEPVLGSSATRERVRSLLFGDIPWGIIHFAGHGYYDNRGLQGIALSDGVLTADELITEHARKLKAQVVCLMACWTGMVNTDVWNELHGFVRGLLVAGVLNVVASSFPLDDTFARTFCENFYADYRSDWDPVGAFRRAFVETRKPEDATSWGGLYITGKR